jgi:hypothetical protein
MEVYLHQTQGYDRIAKIKLHIIDQGCPSQGSRGILTGTATTFVNCIHIAKIIQYFPLLCIPLFLIFTHVAHSSSHNIGCGPLAKEVGHPCPNRHVASNFIFKHLYVFY